MMRPVAAVNPRSGAAARRRRSRRRARPAFERRVVGGEHLRRDPVAFARGMRASRNPRTPRRIVGIGSSGRMPRVRGSLRIGPLHHAVEQRRILDRARHRPRRVERRAQRQDAVGADPPDVVLSPVMPHQEAGSRTEPPVSVPIAQGAMPGGDRHARAGARPAGRARAPQGPKGSTACPCAGWCPSRPSRTRPYGSCR